MHSYLMLRKAYENVDAISTEAFSHFLSSLQAETGLVITF